MICIVHKLPHGNVDLELAGKAKEINQIKQIMKLPTNMVLTKAAKSAAIRIKVPIIDATKSFDFQIDAVNQGINAAKLLIKLAIGMDKE